MTAIVTFLIKVFAIIFAVGFLFVGCICAWVMYLSSEEVPK